MSLRINRLTKAYENKILFEDFSYEFEDRGLYLITGESGIGKTTLLRIIAGLDKDYVGELTGGGLGFVSMAFQEYRLFPELSGLDNLIYSISDRKDEAVLLNAKNMLSALGFSDDDMKLSIDEMSGGMMQRISVGRALLRDAPILLLDEPTKELDADNRQRLYRIIKEESEKRLVIMVSHRDDDISLLAPILIKL